MQKPSSFLLQQGSLALRSKESRETLKQMIKTGTFSRVLCDVNLRPPFYTMETVDFCLRSCDHAKLNEEELSIICELFMLQGSSLEMKMQNVLRHFELKRLVVTLGSKEAAYMEGSSFGIVPAVSIQVKDPVGAGDGFCAGFLIGLERGRSLEEACKMGNELGAYIASQTSSIPSYTIEQFDHWRSSHV